jgi:phospholipid-binding lipoprotein MlaA
MKTNKRVGVVLSPGLWIEMSARKFGFRILFLAAVILLPLLSDNKSLAAETHDPFMSVNRTEHGFNRTADVVVFKPLAKTYQNVTPRFVKKGIRNFFSNLDDVQVIINDLLQLNLKQAGSDFGRLAINSTVGVGGVFNIAGDVLGMEKHDEDFGQTLAHWGVAPGPYVVLPLLGPSTIRESFGLATNLILNPLKVEGAGTQDKIFSLAAIDARASFLNFDELIVGDEYLFLRSIYLQRLEFKSSDGTLQVSLTDF